MLLTCIRQKGLRLQRLLETGGAWFSFNAPALIYISFVHHHRYSVRGARELDTSGRPRVQQVYMESKLVDVVEHLSESMRTLYYKDWLVARLQIVCTLHFPSTPRCDQDGDCTRGDGRRTRVMERD